MTTAPARRTAPELEPDEDDELDTPNGPVAATAVEPADRPVWSIRWIVAAAMVGLVAATVLGVGAFAERGARRAIELELRGKITLQAQNLAAVGAGAMLSDVPEWTLLPLIKDLLAGHDDYAFVVFTDPAGAIVAESETRRLGTRFEPPAGLAPLPEETPGAAGAPVFANRELLVTSTAVVQGDGRPLGMVWLGLHRASIDRRLEAARRQQFLVLGLFLVVGVLAALALSSLVLRPVGALRAGLDRIGRGDLDTRLEVRDRTEIGALAGTINRMTRELKRAQSERIERERMAHEVQLARRIQRALLPSGRRALGSFVIEGEQRQAMEVGGDYYQVVDLPDGRLGLVMADVSGKGLGGSLVTTMLHALVRSTAPRHGSPASMLEALDQQLAGMLERGSFVTMFYGVLDPAAAELVFASAGHNPLLVVRRFGSVEWSRAKGAPLAALRGRVRAQYEDVRIQLEPGDVALQYTDGITEAPAPDAEMFGAERLARVTAGAAGGGSRSVLQAIAEEVSTWRAGAAQHDDETVLMMARELDAAGAASSDLASWMARFVEAERHGRRLTLPATRAALVRVDDWVATCPGLSALHGRAAELLRLALHEACLNVVQHAYQDDARQQYDLWWVPEDRTAATPAVPRGFFLLRDHGRTFRYHEWNPPNLEDPAVRRKGHGFGIDIMRRAMGSITYAAGTPQGNLTCLIPGPNGAIVQEAGDGHEQQ
jgi:serine phosphatase RsbU (regulator of sigma subunit)/anti-sigma regulatory factor (Ser/Thr protein kinase)